MSNTPTESTATDHAAMTALTLRLVSALRRERDTMSRQRDCPVSFAAVVHAGRSNQFLMELAELLDQNTPQDVDSELDKEWRTALQTQQPALS